jgi:putative hydrolase of the HAD superfamily
MAEQATGLQGIRHIIFDLGGVILNIDYGATEKAFASLGIPDFAKHFSQLRQNAFFDDWETGKTEPDAWLKTMRETCGVSVTDEQITDAWNAMLLDFPLRRLQILQQLRIHYDLFLLSNTNAIHEEAFNKILREQTGLPGLGVLFDKVYYSHRIGMRKPDAAPFRHILEENGLKAEHTLFIDDSPQHVETARSLGVQTIYLGPGMTIEEIFRK